MKQCTGRQPYNNTKTVYPIQSDSGKHGDNVRPLLYLDPGHRHRRASGLSETGWQVYTVCNQADIQALATKVSMNVGLVCLDTNDGGDILDTTANILSANPFINWIALVSGDPAANPALYTLISKYCYDFFIHPFKIDHLMMTVGHASGMARLQAIKTHTTSPMEQFMGMIGNSEPMQQIYARIRKIAAVTAPVLLTGASGTGKELIANTIHQLSDRKDKPFVAVNCAALPAALIQSELFGHEKGAFTGAHNRHIGRFEAANSGTIFLDEISDIPMELQINLLRFLEESEIERLGSTNSIAVDARVIAASHEDLLAAIRDGRFREDLFYRLNVLQLKIPCLCERTDDIVLLAEHTLHLFSGDIKTQSRGFSKSALQAMLHYGWPGNVRELINLVRRAMIMAEGRLITPADLGLEDNNQRPAGQTLDETRMHAARHAIEANLRRTRNNISQTARELGISRTTLYRLMAKLGTTA
jgi:DNA-binding NtrC family response regulator